MANRNKSYTLAGVTGLIYLFLYTPIVVLIGLSFNSSRFSTIWQGFTWKWYTLAWHDTELISSMRLSLIVALAATAISTLIGTGAALALARYQSFSTRLAQPLVFLPVVIPEIIIGFATAAFFGLIGFKLGLSAVIATHVTFSISYVVFIVRARVAGLDNTLEAAAMDLGATPAQTFLRITLPRIAPGIISAALLVFTLSLDDYVITSFVAGPGATTLPLKIYSMVKTGVTPEINAISSVLLIATVMLVFVADRIASGQMSRLSRAVAFTGLVLLAGFALGGRGSHVRGGEITIFIWSNYLPDSVIAEFEQRYDAHVTVELYDSNEALLAKLQSGGAAYDIIVPSDYMVEVLRRQNLIQELDRDRIANFSNLDPALVAKPYDPFNQFAIPYLWGTSGIGFRKDKVGEIESWDALWDPRYKDRLAMLDDTREAFGAALKRTGKSLNTTDADMIAEAARALEEQKPLLRAYDSGAFDQLLLSGDAWIVQGYSGQIAKAMAENPSIGYVIPREGCTVSIDNMCVPRNAPHAELAYQFINFVLEARVAGDIANETGYSSPNLAARAFIRPELLSNPAVYPPPEAIRRCEFVTDLGPSVTIYDRFWTEIKSK